MKLTETKLRQIIREELGLHTITISDPEKIARELEYFNPDPYDFDPDFGVLGVQGLYDDLGQLADEVGGLMMSGGIETPKGSGEYTPLLIQGSLKDLVAFGVAVRRELGGRQGLPRAFDAQITALESSL